MSDSSPFTGLCAFPLTPADNQGIVDVETLSRLVEHLCDAGVDSIGLLGSTGTYAYLSRQERRRAVDAAVECIGGRVPLVVGVGALRTDHAQHLARDAEGYGADAVLMAPVPTPRSPKMRPMNTIARSPRSPACPCAFTTIPARRTSISASICWSDWLVFPL